MVVELQELNEKYGSWQFFIFLLWINLNKTVRDEDSMFLIMSGELCLSNQLAALWKFSLATDRDFMHFFSNPHTRWALSILSTQMLRSQPLEDRGFYSLFARVIKRLKFECLEIWVSRNLFFCSLCQRSWEGWRVSTKWLGNSLFNVWTFYSPRAGVGREAITKKSTNKDRQA